MSTKHIEVKLAGMHCDSCVTRVREALAACPGLDEVEVEVGLVRAAFDAERCTARQVVQAAEVGGAFRATGFQVK